MQSIIITNMSLQDRLKCVFYVVSLPPVRGVEAPTASRTAPKAETPERSTPTGSRISSTSLRTKHPLMQPSHMLLQKMQ